jgi:AcrR family transcriptional regulator
MTDDTRTRILRVALEEFSARGFHETSVRELAERVGVTKTAVLYHFPGKADIVTALAEPMLADFETALATAAEAPDTRRAAIEGLLDVWLTHRYLLRMNLRDLGLTASAVVFERFRDGMLKANALVAGPDADFAALVRAAQAIAMLSDPVVLFAEAPEAALRAAVLDGVDRLFTAGSESGPPAASPERAAAGRRSHRGRPSAMTHETVEAARRLRDAGRAPAEIATELGVSRATIYRHLPGAE